MKMSFNFKFIVRFKMSFRQYEIEFHFLFILDPSDPRQQAPGFSMPGPQQPAVGIKTRAMTGAF